MPFFDFQLAGYWNASTNDRGLKSGKGQRGQLYLVTVAGNTVLDGIGDWYVGDIAWFDDFVWRAIPGPNRPASFGLITATGSVTPRSIQNRFADAVNVKDYGVGTGIASADKAGFELALATGRPVYVPDMQIFLTSKINVPQFTVDGRAIAPRIYGVGRYGSIINTSMADTAFEYAFDSDAIFFGGIQIKTTTGGGLRLLGGCGGFVVDDFFMNGCGAGFWGIDQPQSFIYPGVIRNSRFWHVADSYLGGVLRSGSVAAGSGSLAWSLENNFISRQMKDGAIIELFNCVNFGMRGGQMEGTNPASTVQTFYSLNGFNSSVVIDNVYFEGMWNLIIGGSGSTSDLGMRDCRCWQYSTGHADAQILVAGVSQRNWRVRGIEFYSEVEAASALPIIDAPFHNVEIEAFYNASYSATAGPPAHTGNQLARPVSQLWSMKNNAGVAASAGATPQPVVTKTPRLLRNLGNAGVGNPIAGNIFLLTDVADSDAAKSVASVWWVTVTIISVDGLNAVTGTFEVIYDQHGYTAVNLMKAAVSKGAGAPTALGGTVTGLGVFTPFATQQSNQNHYMSAYGELRNVLF